MLTRQSRCRLQRCLLHVAGTKNGPILAPTAPIRRLAAGSSVCSGPWYGNLRASVKDTSDTTALWSSAGLLHGFLLANDVSGGGGGYQEIESVEVEQRGRLISSGREDGGRNKADRGTEERCLWCWRRQSSCLRRKSRNWRGAVPWVGSAAVYPEPTSRLGWIGNDETSREPQGGRRRRGGRGGREAAAEIVRRAGLVSFFFFV